MAQPEKFPKAEIVGAIRRYKECLFLLRGEKWPGIFSFSSSLERMGNVVSQNALML